MCHWTTRYNSGVAPEPQPAGIGGQSGFFKLIEISTLCYRYNQACHPSLPASVYSQQSGFCFSETMMTIPPGQANWPPAEIMKQL